MATTEGRVRVTVDLDDRSLYDAIRHAAVERHRSVGSIVVAALRKWLEEYEAEKDLQDSVAAEEARRDSEPSMSLEDYARSRGWGV